MEKSLQAAQIFTDHMVLQRNGDIPIWGTAQDGDRIEIEFCGHTGIAEAVNGKWRVTLPPMSAGGPFEMIIRSRSAEIVLKDILIGDVWLAGGQSNMELSLAESLGGQEEVSLANDAGLRYYHVPKVEYEEEGEQEDKEPKPDWDICSPESAGAFSAVAYHFAKNLRQDLQVPIGIIDCCRGGTSASCWMSRECLAADDQIKVYLDEFHDTVKTISDEEFAIQLRFYDRQVEDYLSRQKEFRLACPDAAVSLMDKSIGVYPWPPPMGRKARLRPAGLYYTMLQKIVPYGIKGVIYYQGEGDSSKAGLYRRLFSTLIQNWREDWGMASLPFLFVQLPMFGCDGNPDGEDWAIIREQQLLVANSVEHTAMAVITDCGEFDNIHPVNKKPVGERLALLARARIYGDDIEYSGPVYRSMRIEGNKIILAFDHAEGGLAAGNGALRGFRICGEDRHFVEAKADVKGNMIEVCAEEVKLPVAVRYGWANDADVNLYNRAGLPASPFRTDLF